MRPLPKIPIIFRNLGNDRYYTLQDGIFQKSFQHLEGFNGLINALLESDFSASNFGGYQEPVFQGYFDDEQREVLIRTVDLINKVVSYQQIASAGPRPR